MPRIVWQNLNLTWLLASLLLVSCSSPVTDDRLHALTNPVICDAALYHDLLAQELWKSENVQPETFEFLDWGLVQAVAPDNAVVATGLLKDCTWTPINFSTAKKLVGENYITPRQACAAAIQRKVARIEELDDMKKSFTDSASDYEEWQQEQRDQIKKLEGEVSILKPYLCRAVAFYGCGTGGFGASFDGALLRISYGGLGTGAYKMYNHPVVVFLPNPPTKVGFINGVAQ
jgi:hypothetical protein